MKCISSKDLGVYPVTRKGSPIPISCVSSLYNFQEESTQSLRNFILWRHFHRAGSLQRFAWVDCRRALRVKVLLRWGKSVIKWNPRHLVYQHIYVWRTYRPAVLITPMIYHVISVFNPAGQPEDLGHFIPAGTSTRAVTSTSVIPYLKLDAADGQESVFFPRSLSYPYPDRELQRRGPRCDCQVK